MKRVTGNKMVCLALAMALILITGCGSSSMSAYTENAVVEDATRYGDSSSIYNAGGAMDDMAVEGTTADTVDKEGEAAETAGVETNRKLIKTVYLDVETTEFTTLLSNLEQKVEELGGYVENSEVYGGGIYDKSSKSAQFTIRVPAVRLETFVGEVAEAANVTRKNENVEDITLKYVDTKSKKESLEVEKERLMVLLEQADSIETIIALETRLTEIRYQLETMESQLRTYDNLVDYATVTIYVSEVKVYTPEEPETIWERISTGFADSLRGVGKGTVDFIIGLIVALPYLVVWGVVITVIVVVIRTINKKRKVHKKKKLAEQLKKSTQESIEERKENDGKTD